MFVLLCCAALWSTNAGRAYANQSGTVVTGGSGLNMRTGIGTVNPVVTMIPNGTQISVLDTAAGADAAGTAWYKVSYNGQEGYVSSVYISLSQTSTGDPAVSPSPGIGTESATPAVPSVTPTTVPTATPTAVPVQPQKVKVYRTKTTYKAVKVPAKLKKEVSVKKNTSGKLLRVKNKKVVLKKGKSVKIVGEKLKGKTKWFKIQFRYNKKTRKGYIKSTETKLTLSQTAGGIVTGVKTALRVRRRPGNTQPYYKVNGRELVLAKKQYAEILKTRTVGDRKSVV